MFMEFFENYSNDITNDACVLVLENDIDDSNAAPASLPPADITFQKGTEYILGQ